MIIMTLVNTTTTSVKTWIQSDVFATRKKNFDHRVVTLKGQFVFPRFSTSRQRYVPRGSPYPPGPRPTAAIYAHGLTASAKGPSHALRANVSLRDTLGLRASHVGRPSSGLRPAASLRSSLAGTPSPLSARFASRTFRPSACSALRARNDFCYTEVYTEVGVILCPTSVFFQK